MVNWRVFCLANTITAIHPNANTSIYKAAQRLVTHDEGKQAMMKKQSAVILLTALLVGCSQLADRHIEYQQETPVTFPVITAVGAAPISAQPGASETQRMLMAMRASKLEAYRELAERVYGQRIDSKNTLSAMVAQNDVLEASVQGVISGARVVKTYAVEDTYITELSLDFAEVYATLQHTAPKQTIRSVRYLW